MSLPGNIIDNFNNLTDDEKVNTLNLISDGQKYLFTEIFSKHNKDAFVCKECDIFRINREFELVPEIVPDLCSECYNNLNNHCHRVIHKYYICVDCVRHKHNLNCCLCDENKVIDADLLRSEGFVSLKLFY